MNIVRIIISFLLVVVATVEYLGNGNKVSEQIYLVGAIIILSTLTERK